MYIYFEVYKNTYIYTMYFYTFFNNNTMHLIVLWWMYIYFEMYKNTYGYMYFYTFFNNNTMHLIVLLLKSKQLKEETSVI